MGDQRMSKHRILSLKQEASLRPLQQPDTGVN